VRGQDNRRFYEQTAFDSWAARSGLTTVEDALVRRFLDRRATTVEAGTGAGRILFDLRARGFRDLHGFDYVPDFIALARRRDEARTIDFSVQDAVDLTYPDRAFDQAIYLQQVLCFIERAADRRRAVAEAARILRPGGTALFSFLSFEARTNRRLYAAFTRYLHAQRRLRRRHIDIQYQPWLQAADRPNLGALVDKRPYVYWYRLREALAQLDDAGFDIAWTASTAQLHDDTGPGLDPEHADPAALGGMVYVACRRRR
jgi:SAM-dependent methyltransferase